jgi:hypothetical protein
MTFSHIVCTNSGGLRFIQPIHPSHVGFCETSDGGCLGIMYRGGDPVTDPLKEPFVQIMRAMVAGGMALDCTGSSVDAREPANYWQNTPREAVENIRGLASELHPQNIIENLKKQLAMQDDALSEANKSLEYFHSSGRAFRRGAEKIGWDNAPDTLWLGIEKIFSMYWDKVTEIHRLNALLGQLERKYGVEKQPAPPIDPSDEGQGIGFKDDVTG